MKHLPYKWTVGLSLITPVLFLIALRLAIGGHGTFMPGTMLFPFGTIGSLIDDDIPYLFLAIAILQYPIYGFIIDRSLITGKRFTWLLLICIHAAVAFMIFLTMV